MITIENLTLKTRETILEDTSFVFERGKIYGIVAVNGSGKTSLFRAVNQLIPLSAGNITIDDTLSLFYYESTEWLDRSLAGYDYLLFVKGMWKSSVDLEQEILYWEMQDYIHLPIAKYSLGMKQRLLIAMYFVSGADCWFMDEITNGLDEYHRTKFFKRLVELPKQSKTIIVSSHYQEDLREICDIMLEINAKKLQEVAI